MVSGEEVTGQAIYYEVTGAGKGIIWTGETRGRPTLSNISVALETFQPPHGAVW